MLMVMSRSRINVLTSSATDAPVTGLRNRGPAETIIVSAITDVICVCDQVAKPYLYRAELLLAAFEAEIDPCPITDLVLAVRGWTVRPVVHCAHLTFSPTSVDYRDHQGHNDAPAKSIRRSCTLLRDTWHNDHSCTQAERQRGLSRNSCTVLGGDSRGSCLGEDKVRRL